MRNNSNNNTTPAKELNLGGYLHKKTLLGDKIQSHSAHF